MSVNSETLVGLKPSDVLPHGPSKILVHDFLWHSPNLGIISSYTPSKDDVRDHFGVFRGVDQIESFGQSSIIACSAFLEAQKKQINYTELYKKYQFVFLSSQQVNCHSFLKEGETFINYAFINYYKFRQMSCSGKILSVPEHIDIHNYMKTLTEEDFSAKTLEKECKVVAEFHEIIGKGILEQRLQEK
ncbi:MAG: hypothetical protein JXQ96_02500 [Cyclobacteriaceae bacterium]